MTIRYSSDQLVCSVAEIGTERVDFVDVRSPGAIRPCAAEVHVDETVIAELGTLGPHSSAYSGNPKPSGHAAANHCSVGTSLLERHCRMGRVRYGVDTLPERLRTLHRARQHLDRAQIESSIYSELDLLQKI